MPRTTISRSSLFTLTTLAAAVSVAGAQQPPATRPDSEYAAGQIGRGKRSESTEGLAGYTNQVYRPLRSGEFYSAGFLSEGQDLPFGVLLGAVTPPQIRELSERTTLSPFTQVGIRPPEHGTYARGDSVTIYTKELGFPGHGDMIIPMGMVRITGQSEHQYLGEVVTLYGAMRGGMLVLPTEKFSPGPEAKAVPVTDSLHGVVLGGRELRELKHPQNILFLSIGKAEGVARGDLFEIRRVPGARPYAADAVDEMMASGQIVRVGEHSSTILLLHIVSPDIPPGMRALRIARLPQ